MERRCSSPASALCLARINTAVEMNNIQGGRVTPYKEGISPLRSFGEDSGCVMLLLDDMDHEHPERRARLASVRGQLFAPRYSAPNSRVPVA